MKDNPKFNKYKGKKFFNNEKEEFEIIEYFSSINLTVKFNDGTIVKNKRISNINTGYVKNPKINKPTVFNTGYLGIGKYSFKNDYKAYCIWHSMLRRCYCEKVHIKASTYIGCTVDERWHNFQVFAEWYYVNYIEDFELDKDLLINGNKIYSPETCCFVPLELNRSFITNKRKINGLPRGISIVKNKYRVTLCKFGINNNLGSYPTIERAFKVYKENKELYYKQLAAKLQNKIPVIIYNFLINYNVKITDT